MGLGGGGNTTPSCGPDMHAVNDSSSTMVGIRDDFVIGCLHNHASV